MHHINDRRLKSLGTTFKEECSAHKRQRKEEKRGLRHGSLPLRGQRETTEGEKRLARHETKWRGTSVRDLPAMATNRKNIHVSMSLPVEKKPPLPPLLAGKARLSITRRDASLILTHSRLHSSFFRFRGEDAYTPTDSRCNPRITEKSLEQRAHGRARDSSRTQLHLRLDGICPAALQCPSLTSYIHTLQRSTLR